MRQPVEGESARWLAVATMATMATPFKKMEKKIPGECPLVNTTHPPHLAARIFESLDRGVAMVAMVAIDDRTRIASSRRQAEAREW